MFGVAHIFMFSLLYVFTEEFSAHGANVNCLSLGSKSGRVLVTGGDDRKVNLWAVGKPSCIMVRTRFKQSTAPSQSFPAMAHCPLHVGPMCSLSQFLCNICANSCHLKKHANLMSAVKLP